MSNIGITTSSDRFPSPPAHLDHITVFSDDIRRISYTRRFDLEESDPILGDALDIIRQYGQETEARIRNLGIVNRMRLLDGILRSALPLRRFLLLGVRKIIFDGENPIHICFGTVLFTSFFTFSLLYIPLHLFVCCAAFHSFAWCISTLHYDCPAVCSSSRC